MKVNKKADVSASLREKIVSGKIGEYIPEKQSYKTYREVVVEYQDKLFEFIRANEPLPLKWNETWFEQNGYLVKPDSPRGSLEELDLFRVSSQTKRKFEGYRQTPDFEPIEGWGSNSKLKSPFNLEKLEAHHVRGLMQESTFLQGLEIEEATDLVNRMWKSGRTKFGNTLLNRIDLQDKQHLNAYSAKELAVLREADPDAVGIVFNKETGKWEKQGWKKINGKWRNPLYKGTGIHNILAEHGISDITGAPMFSPKTMKGMKGKNLDQLFEEWSGWYDYTDRTIEQALIEAKTNPRNFRGKIPEKAKGRTFQELLKAEREFTPNQVMNIVDEAFPELSEEARLLIQADIFGPDPAREPKIRNLLAKPTPTLELSRQQQSEVNEALRQALFVKETKRTKIPEKSRLLQTQMRALFGDRADAIAENLNKPFKHIKRKAVNTAKGFARPLKSPVAKSVAIVGGTALTSALHSVNVQAKEQDFEDDPTLSNRLQLYSAQGERKLDEFGASTGLFGKPVNLASWALTGFDLALEAAENPEDVKAVGEALIRPSTYTEVIPEVSRNIWKNKEILARGLGIAAKDFALEAVDSTIKDATAIGEQMVEADKPSQQFYGRSALGSFF